MGNLNSSPTSRWIILHLIHQKKIEYATNFIEKEEKPFIFVYSQVGSDFLSLYDPKGKIKKALEEKSTSKLTYGIYSESILFLYFYEK